MSQPMTHSARVDCEMRAELPASLRAVEEFFVGFRLKSQALLDRVNCFAAELLVREALTNAVVHGCHSDPNKQVRCFLRLKGRHLLIAVVLHGDQQMAAGRRRWFRLARGEGQNRGVPG